MDNYLFVPRAVVAALYDVAFAAAVGVILCAFWVPHKEATAGLQRRLRGGLVWASGVLLGALLAQLWVVTATMVGSAAPNDVVPQLRDVLTGTHSGRIAAVALVPGVILMALGVASMLRKPMSRGMWIAASCDLLALVLLRSATGHAAAQGDFSIGEAMQCAHLCGTAVWAGLILVAGLLAAPALLRQEDCVTLAYIGKRVSSAATVAVGVIIASGLYNAWRGLGGAVPLLVQTQWGWLLTVKSTLVFVALMMGLYNRMTLRRNAVLLPADATRFARGLRLEAAFMFTILTLSAFLANSMPANMNM